MEILLKAYTLLDKVKYIKSVILCSERWYWKNNFNIVYFFFYNNSQCSENSLILIFLDLVTESKTLPSVDVDWNSLYC